MSDWFQTPLIFTAILAVVSSLVGIGVWVGRISERLANLKENADNDRSVLKEFMQEIRDDIKKILRGLPPQTATGTSPMRLTDLGERIAESISALAWAAAEADSIINDETLLDLEPFQIEAFCERHVTDGASEEGTIRDKVLEAAYEFGIDKSLVLPVLRIPLRDALLKRREALL